MTRTKLTTLFIAFLLGCLHLMAQTSVEVSLPRRAVAGQRFTLTVTVNNPDGRVADFRGPDLEGCTFRGGPGVSSSSYTQIINGRMQSSSSTGYTFSYVADREGIVQVPAITVQVNGKSYTTRAGQFEVMPAPAGSAQQTSMGGSGSSQQQSGARPSGSGRDFAVGASDLFMRVHLSSASVYEQQAVECSIKLYSSNGQVSALSATAIPNFDGCLIETIGMPNTLDWHSENVNGQNYYTATVYRAILYPQRSGQIKLTGGEYTIRVYRQILVQDFFMTRPEMQEKDVKVNPSAVTLNVKALPEPRPAGFSGAVGNFTASARLVGNSFKTNEASSLIYTVEGTGNIKFLTDPTIDFPSEFEVYDPSVSSSAKVSGANMTGTQTTEFTFVPQSVGKFRIGAHDFIYFNPSTGKYVTVPIDGYEIDVEKGADVAPSSSVSKNDIVTKNTDIHHIKPDANRPGSPLSPIAHSTLYWLLYPLLAIALSALLYRVIKRRGADLSERRFNKAGKVARQRLNKAGKLLKASQYEPFYEELLRAMLAYMSDKFGLPASQLNRDNISASLAARGASDTLIAAVIDIINECEMARYTPGLTSENADKVFDSARDCINNIENL